MHEHQLLFKGGECMMVNVQTLQHMPILEIVKVLKIENSVTVDFSKLAHTLKVSVLPQNFEENKIDGEKIICAFVTNEKGNSCIFYSDDLVDNKEFLGRIIIAQAFAKYIITGENNFFVTQSTIFSNREKLLTYEMLMPKSQVEDVLDKLLLPKTFTLAEIFQVSKEFVRQRLDEMCVTTLIKGYNC